MKTPLGRMALWTLLTAIASPALAEFPLSDFGKGTKFGKAAQAPELGRDARKQVTIFRRKARYFGALAANPDTQHVYYVFNFFDIAKAREAALEGCRQISEAKGCRIYAVAMPQSLPVNQARASGLSEEASITVHGRYQEHRKPGKFSAFAISGSSHFGFANAYDTAADAKDTALAYCNRGVAADMADIGPRGREFARARGYNRCRVIHIEQAPEN